MKNQQHFLYRQVLRKTRLLRTGLLGILLLLGGVGCNAMGQNQASVSTQIPELTASPAPAIGEGLSTPTAGAPSGQGAGVETKAATNAAALTPAPREGWTTFIAPNLYIAVDYPSQWTVKQDPTGAIFTSPQGSTIQLSGAQAGGLSPQSNQNEVEIPNTRCYKSTNQFGLSAQICLDTISFSLKANFVIEAHGNSETVALVSGKSGDKSVFDAMVASLRIIP